MSGDRRKRKQATLADLHSNFRSMLPSHAVPRGQLKNALVKTARGVGKSQFVIPDRWMKYPQNETSNVVEIQSSCRSKMEGGCIVGVEIQAENNSTN